MIIVNLEVGCKCIILNLVFINNNDNYIGYMRHDKKYVHYYFISIYIGDNLVENLS